MSDRLDIRSFALATKKVTREVEMASVSFQYGGTRGKKHKLVESSEYLVVRTKGRDSLANTPLSEHAHRSIQGWHPVLHLEDAGVEVLQSFDVSRRTVRRNAARATLKQESEIHFAGRVLCSPQGQQPVIYTQNLFIKFDDDVSPHACRKLLRTFNLLIKREVGYARNAYFVSGGISSDGSYKGSR